MTKLKFFIGLIIFLLASSTAFATSELDSLKTQYHKTQDVSEKLLIGEKLTRLFRRTNYDSAVHYALKNNELSQQEGTAIEEGVALTSLGLVYFYSNDYERFLTCFQKANEIFESEEYYRGIGVNRATEAIYYNRIGQNDKGIDLALQSLELLSKHGKPGDKRKPLSTLGILYMREAQYEQATKYLEEALELTTDSAQMANCLNNLGTVFLRQKKYTEAIPWFEKTLRIDSSQGNLAGMSSTYSNLGVCYKNLEDYGRAMELHQLSLKLDYMLNSQRGVAASMNNIGTVLLQKKQFKAARDTFKKGLSITKALGDKGISMDILTNLSDAFYGLKNYDSALYYFKEFKALSDSVYNLDRQRRISEIETRYQLENKNNQILLLDSKLAKKKQQNYFVIFIGVALFAILILAYNRFRVKQKLQLKMQQLEYEQKLIQLQLNPHFIFNSLASISSYVSLQDKDKAIRYLSKFAKLIRARLEHGRKGSITVQEEIINIQNYLDLEQIRLEIPFDYKIDVAPTLNLSAEIPPTLIQPFLENAVVHGFENDATNNMIVVHFYDEDGKVVAEVQDNGIGRDESEKRKLLKTVLHESLSTKILKEYFEKRNKNSKRKLEVRITDLNENNHSFFESGTSVRIELSYLNTFS